MVAKWERGVKSPSRRYRELLCLLFAVEANELGIHGAVNGATRQAAGPTSEDSSLVAVLSGAASLLDELGAAAALLRPKMFEVWKDELMQRRALLKLMGVAPAVGF